MRRVSSQQIAVRRTRDFQECQARFIRLYARWERTHNLELIPLLCHHLDRLVKLEPRFDLRRQFAMAF